MKVREKSLLLTLRPCRVWRFLWPESLTTPPMWGTRDGPSERAGGRGGQGPLRSGHSPPLLFQLKELGEHCFLGVPWPRVLVSEATGVEHENQEPTGGAGLAVCLCPVQTRVLLSRLGWLRDTHLSPTQDVVLSSCVTLSGTASSSGLGDRVILPRVLHSAPKSRSHVMGGLAGPLCVPWRFASSP